MTEENVDKKMSDTPATEAKPAAEATKKMTGPLIGAAIVLLIVIIAAVSYALVYRVSGTNGYEQLVAQTFKLPVAKVNGEKLLLAEFNDNVAATEYFFDQQDAQALGLVGPMSGTEIREQELEAMINSALLNELAEERGIEVTAEEIDTYFNDVVVPQAPGGLDEVTQTLKDLYNWTPEEFKESVLEDIVLQQELQQYLADDEEENATLLEEITTMREDILSDEDTTFAEYATRYSQDPGSAANEGSLGSFGKGVMVPEFEEAAFNTPVGEISEPVKTVFGYHILFVTARDDEAETVEASHILLTFDTLESLLQEAQDAAEITKYLPVYEEEEADDADNTESDEETVVVEDQAETSDTAEDAGSEEESAEE